MYRIISTSERYPEHKGKYFVISERGTMEVLEWTGEITIGWRNTDFWLEAIPYYNMT